MSPATLPSSHKLCNLVHLCFSIYQYLHLKCSFLPSASGTLIQMWICLKPLGRITYGLCIHLTLCAPVLSTWWVSDLGACYVSRIWEWVEEEETQFQISWNSHGGNKDYQCKNCSMCYGRKWGKRINNRCEWLRGLRRGFSKGEVFELKSDGRQELYANQRLQTHSSLGMVCYGSATVV